MADATRVVFLSDLHLGSNPALDDFVRDRELAALLRAPELARPAVGDCELVLLGDTFDLWQAVTDDECGANPGPVPIEYGAADERCRLEGVIARQRDVMAALGEFARRPGTRLVVVVGNHDHSLVNAEVRGALEDALGDEATVSFQSFYENRTLGLYAEHGNQYDRNNRFATFGGFDWREDARGYYFVRLFFNRIERRDPTIENSPGGWAAVWYWLRKAGNLELLAYAIRCFGEYARDPRVKRHLTLEGAREGGGARAGAGELVDHREAPVLLVTGASAGGAFFSADPEMERFLREAYARSPEVRAAVDEVLGKQGRAGATPPSGDVPPAPSTEGVLGGPRDPGWAEALFTTAPALRVPAAPLDPAVFHTVIFGHTHAEMTRVLANGKTYVNTGSWTAWSAGGTVVTVEAGGAPGQAVVRRRHFDGVRFLE